MRGVPAALVPRFTDSPRRTSAVTRVSVAWTPWMSRIWLMTRRERAGNDLASTVTIASHRPNTMMMSATPGIVRICPTALASSPGVNRTSTGALVMPTSLPSSDFLCAGPPPFFITTCPC